MSVHGAVTSPHARATDAGAQAFAAGGNAIDAALAAAAALTVVYPHQCSVGGDLFALVDDGAGHVWAVNGSGAAPAAMTAAALRTRYREMPDSGPDSVTVPGVIAAWHSIHGLGARLPIEQLLAPAIHAAAEGVSVSASLARGIQFRRTTLQRDPGSRDLLLPHGQPLTAGATLRQPQLARTLQCLAADGLDDFYSGSLAKRLAAGLQRLGSVIRVEDLAGHRTELTPPLQLEHRGFQIHTCPPNSQGVMLLQAIAALDALGLESDSLGDGARYLLAALMAAAEDRDQYLGDPRRVAVRWPDLCAPERLRRRVLSRIDGEAPRGDSPYSTPAHGDTVAVCALDATGIAVSLIQSVYQTFGSGLLDPGTGVIFHNRARGFSLQPGAANELAPGMRPAHTLLPVLVRRNARTVAAVGTMGGRAQAQILAQLLPAVLDVNSNLMDRLRAPRWIFGTRDIDFPRPTVAIEQDAPEALDRVLRIDSMDVARIPAGDERAGHAQVVRTAPDGRFEAVADPRSDGSGHIVTGAGSGAGI